MSIIDYNKEDGYHLTDDNMNVISIYNIEEIREAGYGVKILVPNESMEYKFLSISIEEIIEYFEEEFINYDRINMGDYLLIKNFR